jgi:hypothetical protein
MSSSIKYQSRETPGWSSEETLTYGRRAKLNNPVRYESWEKVI